MLATTASAYDRVDAAWFAISKQPEPPAFIGPLPAAPIASQAIGEGASDDRWLVRLTLDGVAQVDYVEGVAVLLSNDAAEFHVVRGLGLPGLVVVTTNVSDAYATEVLDANPYVAFFQRDGTVETQRKPNDPDFVAGSMVGLDNTGQFGGTANADINAPEVWDEVVGSTDIVVGVIDSGVDATHPDLYLNIWINQGEIRPEIASQLIDVNGDGRITFYDLNDCPVIGSVSDPANCDWTGGPNAGLLTDFQPDVGQANGYIDAIDLLEDPRWADGVDTDGNGFIDDFFGWNFRSGDDEPFAPNNPSDVLGHGTHVAGTIGAIGNNGLGVTGLNWQTSIMALKFLDQDNRGRTSEAILALNYATMMRTRFGVNIPVTNNSWGQAGGFSSSLEAAIRAAGEAEILFVAAAGNGNILGRGVNNDRTPFYPASYALDNIIAVAASDANDQLAQFSNFGATSVDIAAPGVGILSTLPGGRFGTANGTSMATPHVTGAAALIWSALPEARLSEVRDAILASADDAAAFQARLTTNGRLDAAEAVSFDGFSPTASLVSADDITVAGGTNHEFVVQYFDRNAIDPTSLGDGDVVVSRQWGPRDQILATLVPDSVVVSPSGQEVTVKYRIAAPGDSWDALDFGEYRVSIVADEVVSQTGRLSVPKQDIGAFRVRIPDSSVFYVDTFGDSVDVSVGDGLCSDEDGFCSLRAAIQEANASPRITFSSTDVPGPIASNTITSELNVAGIESVTDVNVRLDITHTWVSDLDVFLISPLGTRVHLFSDVGGNSDNFAGVILDDEASIEITSGDAPFTGRFRPEGKLADFDGEDPNGIWKLEVTDDAAGDTGILNAWSLEFTDPSTNVSSTDVPHRIAESNTLTSELNVTGFASVADVNVRLDITHTWVSDLDVVLISPSGTRVHLFSDVGGESDNFSDTILDDEAPVEITAGETPFTGRFRPEGTLADFDGEDPNGIWKLEVTDDAAGDTGTLNEWSLELTGGTTIILEDGSYNLSIRHQPDPTSTFPSLDFSSGCVAGEDVTGWSNESSGDLDVMGSVTILGSATDATVIDGQSVDRVFKVHPGAEVYLRRLTVTSGLAPRGQGGGGIISAGLLDVELVTISENSTVDFEEHAGGGGIALWGGDARIHQTTISGNVADVGGGLFLCNAATATVTQSTFVENAATAGNTFEAAWPGHSGGGGIASVRGGLILVENSTFSANTAKNVSGAAIFGTSSFLFGGPGVSTDPSLSGNGRFVAFVSDASNLVPGDANGYRQVFVFDRQTQTTELVSVASGGTQANRGGANDPSISDDGRFVAFESLADNLVPGDKHGSETDVFVFDRQTQTVERVSESIDGTQANNSSWNPSISGDGRFVTFESAATNLVSGDTNGRWDVFVFDRQTQTIERVSVASDGSQANSNADEPSISDDGRFVAFESNASNLVPGDTNGHSDVFVFDRNTQMIERVSVASDGTQANRGGYDPSISGDGRFVAFESDASNLGPWDPSTASDLFLFDRQTRTIQRVSVASEGTTSSISGDGRFVAFVSDYLEPGDTNDTEAVFVFDRQTQTIERFNVGSDETEASGFSRRPSISGDGRVVAFDSDASNMVPGDTNGKRDVFVFDRQTRPALLTSPNTPSAAEVTLEHVTAAFNVGVSTVSGVVHAHNSLFTANTTAKDFVGGRSLGHNILTSADVSLLPTDRIDPQAGTGVGPIQTAGGPTATHPLTHGSTAIDSGDPNELVVTDQIGTVRPIAGGFSALPDIGAVEAAFGEVRGSVFIDRDSDGNRGTDETSLSNILLYLDENDNDQPDPSEKQSLTALDPNSGVDFGAYAIPFVVPGNQTLRVEVPLDWSVSDEDSLVRVTPDPNLIFTASILSASLSADGRFVVFNSSATNLVPGDTNGRSDVFVFDRQKQTIERVSLASDGTQADGSSGGSLFRPAAPSISGDGRFVAFESWATNLVPGDTNSVSDVFVFDRQKQTIERVSLASDGTQANDLSWQPSISGDGRFVAFESRATNLVPGDTNGIQDVFVFDRQKQTIERVSLASDGTQANNSSDDPSISDDGRFVAFESLATNLIPGDTNSVSDVFVFDRQTKTIDRVSIASDGTQANADCRRSTSCSSLNPSMSGDGRFVAFESDTTNLVPGDTNGASDVFVFDRQKQTIERVSVASDGGQALSTHSSHAPSISSDGRFVAFQSFATTFVPGDTNRGDDIFVFDRQTRRIARVNLASDGAQANGNSFTASMSGDGRYIAFSSGATNFVPNDNSFSDIFVSLNPFRSRAERTVILRPGETKLVDIGLVPNPGEIRGTAFEDTISNGVFDVGEITLEGWAVFLDLNDDRLLGENEPSTVTGADGTYTFTDIDASAEYSVAIVVEDDWEQVLPSLEEGGAWRLFLPAGGTVTDRDFGFVRARTVGQFENAQIDGIVFADDGDGMQEPGENGLGGVTVFLDLNDDRQRQFDEPRTITDETGRYSFSGLGSRPYTVRAILDETRQHQTAPLGNQLDEQISSFNASGAAFNNPHDVVVEDFTGDGVPDLAVALFERNAVSILPGIGNGQFQQAIDINLAPNAAGPTSLFSGDFNNNGSIDLATANLFSGNVTILLDFDGTTFASVQHVSVGSLPRALASGYFDADAGLDLAVANERSNSLTILRNNGNGTFRADATILRVGNSPFSVVAAQLTDDNGDQIASDDDDVDLVVANFGLGADVGSVSVLLNNGRGSFNAPVSYEAGFGPIALSAADFNQDGFSDLAVANFLSDTITLLMNKKDGTFPLKTEQLRGDSLSAGKGPADIEAEDMDNDGDIDLIVANHNSQDISILRNRQSQSGFGFEPAESFGLAAFAAAVKLSASAGDVNQDGVLDLAVANGTDATVSVFLNTLIAGAHRVGLTGVETVSGLNFAIQPLNAPPTLDEIDDPAPVQEDAPQHSIPLTGITAGENEEQRVRVQAVSDNPQLIPNPTVTSEVGTASQRVLVYQPLADQSGLARITITVTDDGPDGIFDTKDDQSISRSFTVQVHPVNDPPTLDQISNPDPVDEGEFPPGFVELDGIFAGGNETQPLGVTAETNNPQLVRIARINYRSPNSLAILFYQTTVGLPGSATITVTVTDGGLDGDLGTAVDNASFSRTFEVVVRPKPTGVAGDFNTDSLVTPEDIDLIYAALATGSPDPIFDLNDDGSLTRDDVDLLVQGPILNSRFGDTNLDRKVDFTDFLVLSASFGQERGWANGDFDGNGMVDFADFLFLSTNFGFDATAAAGVAEDETL